MSETLTLGPIWYVVFLLSLTCHEAAHALAAKLGGDLTAFHAGQVTLDPIPHMRREPFGTILVPILSYILGGWMIGWASAPYDPAWQRRFPRRAALMALAGPLANFILVLIAMLAMWIGTEIGSFNPPNLYALDYHQIVTAPQKGLPYALATFFSILFSLNILLATFNLMPVPPLDGNTVIGLLLPEKIAVQFAELSHNPMFAMVGLIAAWRFFPVVFRPVMRTALMLLNSLLS
ncbi:MAG: hypothetical protein ALAOOOJD_01542 [bacterium]|nr:hypothetical protein [bacterium]